MSLNKDVQEVCPRGADKQQYSESFPLWTIPFAITVFGGPGCRFSLGDPCPFARISVTKSPKYHYRLGIFRNVIDVKLS